MMKKLFLAPLAIENGGAMGLLPSNFGRYLFFGWPLLPELLLHSSYYEEIWDRAESIQIQLKAPIPCISLDKDVLYGIYQKCLMGCNSQSLIDTANYQWQFILSGLSNFSAKFQLRYQGCPRDYFSSCSSILKLDRAEQCMPMESPWTSTQSRA